MSECEDERNPALRDDPRHDKNPVRFLLLARVCKKSLIVIPECFYRESTLQSRMDSRLEHAGMTWYSGFYTGSQAKENEQLSSNIRSARSGGKSASEERSFLCLDTTERTKGQIKAREEMAENFFAELKQIKYVSFPQSRGDEYLFLYPPPRNFLNAIFSQAISAHAQHGLTLETPTLTLGGLRRSFAT